MNRVAIITGGSSGIGRAVVLRLADDGFDVGFTYRSGIDRAEAVANEVRARGRRAAICHLDLSHSDAGDAIDGLIGELGSPAVFVNNAGENRRCAFLEETAEDWARSIMVNLTGAFICAQRAALHMIGAGQGGSIVNVTSVLDREVITGGAAYCTGKAGLRQLTRVMALELASYGIRVNGVAPGETATPMNFDRPVDAAKVVRPVTPLKRPGYSDEIASAIAFLASQASSYVTGEVLLVDGGLSLHGGPQSLQVAVGKPLSQSAMITAAADIVESTS